MADHDTVQRKTVSGRRQYDPQVLTITHGTDTALQHGTGLGLWQLKWAVTTLGGDLEFDTTDGTTVTFAIPDQGVGRSTNA